MFFLFSVLISLTATGKLPGKFGYLGVPWLQTETRILELLVVAFAHNRYTQNNSTLGKSIKTFFLSCLRLGFCQLQILY